MNKPLLNLPQKKTKYILLFILTIFLNIILKIFILDIYQIKGESMMPNLQDKSFVVVLKCSYSIRLPRNIYEIPWLGNLLYYVIPNSLIDYTLHKNNKFHILMDISKVKRNDILIFNIPTYPRDFAAKRCIAIPGDNIEQYIKDCKSPLITPFHVIPHKGDTINKKYLSESEKKLLSKNIYFSYSDEYFISQDDCYFVLGDNFSVSEDSRTWGVIPKSLIVGKVLFSF